MREPILKWGSIVALVKAVVALAISFGLPLADEQVEAIIQIVVLLEPLSVWYLARKHTTPWAPDPSVLHEDDPVPEV